MNQIKLIESELPQIQIPEQKFPKIATVQELMESEKYLKTLVTARVKFVDDFKPVKSEIDKIKSQAIEYEKLQIKPVTEEEDRIKKIQSSFKSEIAELQNGIKRIQSEYKNQIDKVVYQVKDVFRLIDKYSAYLEREAIQNTPAPASEKAEKLDILEKSVTVTVENVIPTQIRPEEKVFLKKDEIKGKEVFSIKDEQAFIEWAILNDRSLLKIEIKKADVKKFLSVKKNQSLSFVKKEIIY